MASTVTVAEIIDEARDFNVLFDKQRNPDRAAMRQVSRAEQMIAQKVTEINESALASVIVVRSLETALSRGFDLPNHLSMLEIAFERNEISRPVALVRYSDRFTEGLRRFPAAYLLGNRLWPINRTLAGEVLHGWEEIDLIRIMLVALPGTHAVPTETIGLPDTARDALVANLAHWMAMRTPDVDARQYEVRAKEAEMTLITNLASIGDTSTWSVRVSHY